MSSIDKQALRRTSERDWFEDWFKREFHPDKTGPYIKDQLFFAVRAARAPLLDELEASQSENERLAKTLIERNGEPVEGLVKRVAELEEIATDYGMKFQRAQDALKHQSLLHKTQMEAAEKRIAELESDNAYIRNRHKELDLLIGKNILVMQAAIIEWQGTGDARKGLAWIYNTLFGPGELPDESEKDAQAYFDRKYAPLDEELMNLHRWLWEQSEAERAATAGK
ncbi:TPA: ead/Ea22-like family protein [Enterobacter cloacae]|nr:ead/Ea22-like family protein [Enterobacter cloacae]